MTSAQSRFKYAKASPSSFSSAATVSVCLGNRQVVALRIHCISGRPSFQHDSCMPVSRLATVKCEPAFPLLNAVWPVLVVVGIAAGVWRYYRDHHCGDMYRDFYD